MTQGKSKRVWPPGRWSLVGSCTRDVHSVRQCYVVNPCIVHKPYAICRRYDGKGREINTPK